MRHLVQKEIEPLPGLGVRPDSIEVMTLLVRDSCHRAEFQLHLLQRLATQAVLDVIDPPKCLPRPSAPPTVVNATRVLGREHLEDRQAFAVGLARQRRPVNPTGEILRLISEAIVDNCPIARLPQQVLHPMIPPLIAGRSEQLDHGRVRVITPHDHIDTGISNELLSVVG